MIQNIAENNLIRFTNISRKKNGMVANFKVQGIRGGTTFSASISVDIASAELDPADSLEKIIEECARIGIAQFKKAEFHFEGLPKIAIDADDKI